MCLIIIFCTILSLYYFFTILFFPKNHVCLSSSPRSKSLRSSYFFFFFHFVKSSLFHFVNLRHQGRKMKKKETFFQEIILIKGNTFYHLIKNSLQDNIKTNVKKNNFGTISNLIFIT